jgi:hypothetical protein
MQKEIKYYLNELTLGSKKRVTNHFKEEVDEISLLLSKNIILLQNYISTIKTPSKDDPQYIGYGLMTKGTNTLMAGLELSLNGYFWEPPILLRNALEGFASAWDIIHNPKRFEIWKANKKFKSTDSISNAKEINPALGQVYGLFSDMYTHIKPDTASPSFVFVEGKPELQFFGFIRNGKENIREGEIYLCLIVTYMCLNMAELCFHQHSNEFETIEKIPGKQYVKCKVTERHRKFVDRSMVIYKNMKDNAEGTL